MIQRSVTILFLLFISSCNTKKNIPSNVLRPEKMQAVLWDMIRADQLSQAIVLQDSTRKIQTENLKLYNKTFQVHKISNEEFRNSISFYQKRPDLMRVILDSIHAKRSREHESNEEIKYLPKSVF